MRANRHVGPREGRKGSGKAERGRESLRQPELKKTPDPFLPSEDNHLELYNLREDISEQNDLAAERSGLATELHQRLVAWRHSIEAKIPQPNPDVTAMLADWATRRKR
jgi:hypothetical protein